MIYRIAKFCCTDNYMQTYNYDSYNYNKQE